MARTFDSLAAAVHWLDAYRERSSGLIDLYTDDAQLECRCIDETISGKRAIQKYYVHRFEHGGNKTLINVRRITNEMIFLTYATSAGSVSTFLGFDGKTGKIEWQRCGPEIAAANRE